MRDSAKALLMHVAAQLVQGMATMGMTFADLDAKLEMKHGTSKRFVVGMLDGQDRRLSGVADLAWAMGLQFQVALEPSDYASPEPAQGGAA